MFEIIGMIAVWLFGAAACFFVPMFAGAALSERKGRGIGDAVLGYWTGHILCAAYIIASVIYLAVT